MHAPQSFSARLLLVSLVALLISACGGPAATPVTVIVTATPDAAPTAVPAPEATPTVEATPAAEATSPATSPAQSGAASTLSEAKAAIVQIEAQGSFIDPEFGLQLNTAGRGSGFIIDPAGLAVTNNHVATGAAFLRVWLADETRPRNARVVGVSECSDLAVIQIDGDDFRYLEWYSGAVEPGLEVYAAGFPLGDPEYTLNRGIVSKARADGRTDWASVNSVIEHDARINPGNSGGPLITSEGKVVGVNYAGLASAGQSFAIGRNEAERVVQQLAAGQDVTSIGVNGQVVSDGSGLTGVWVASVKSGSPADLAGIRGGDILIQLEGLVLGTDGTMADYCDILRSRLPTDPMAITVLRYSTGQVLEGQLNGRELKVAQSFGVEATPVPGAPARPTTPAASYVTVRDDSGALEVEVPASWRDVDGEFWVDGEGEILGAALVVAPDVQAFYDWYDEPGLAFLASRSMLREHTVESFLDMLDPGDACYTNHGREAYDDGLYVGAFDLFTDCEGSSAAMVVAIVAMPPEEDMLVAVLFQANEADMDILERVIASFRVVGSLP